MHTRATSSVWRRPLASASLFMLALAPTMGFLVPSRLGRGSFLGSVRTPIMDNIIESRRIEDMDGFSVEYEINGLRFVKYNSTSSAEKPAIVLFLPGLDGSGCTLGPQIPDLVKTFEVWSLSCPANDRSSFSTLTSAVITHLKRQAEEVSKDSELPLDDAALEYETENGVGNGNGNGNGKVAAGKGKGRATVVVGESFGGLLALAVALTLGKDAQTYIKSLLLVNPATSFANTPWQVIIPLFRDLPARFYPLAVTPALVAVGPDISQFRRVLGRILQPFRPPWEQAQVATETVKELLDLIIFLTQQIPLDTLQWRITRWLQAGSYRVADRLGDITLPVVVAAGTQDRVLPSVSEAARLQGLLPDCSVLTIQGSGHISLDGRVNLTDILTKSPRLLADAVRGGRAYDPVRDFVWPSDEVRQRYTGIVERALERFTSPVFFSTASDGSVIAGLDGVPDLGGQDGRAILFVGNHQLIGLDLGMIIKAFLEDKGMLVRGLAHPALFRERPGGNGLAREVIFTEDQALFSSGFKTSTGGDTTGLRNVFQTFGAVPVSARNFYALLKNGDAVLLFPGGARETYHKKGEDYQVFWPERSEFVRMCATLNATIVPFSAIGCADSFRMVLDSKDLLSLPVIGERVRKASDAIPNARGDGVPEDFIAPILAPVLPARFYFHFGKPITTDGLAPKDKEAVGEVYQNIQREVEVGIEALLRARASDPYRDFVPRLAYERITQRKAPTISPADLQAQLEAARARAVDSKGR